MSDWKSRSARLAVLLMVVTLLGLFFLSGLHERLAWEKLRAQVDAWKATVEARWLTSLLTFAAVYVLCTSLSLPSSLGLSLLAGALFGAWWGLAVVSLSSTAGACLAFLLSRYLFRDSVRRRFGHRLGPIFRGIERDGAWYLLALRLTPVVPYFLINAAMGLTPMPLATYAIVSWLGMLPVGLIIVMAGQELGNISHPADVFTPGVLGSLLAMALVPLALRWLMRRYVGPEAFGEVPQPGAESIQAASGSQAVEGPSGPEA
jgi:uncharacterized membrane protein YdjX (TVP38/TMEM64 family)